MAGQRTSEQIIGEAGAGDEDGRVPAEAKGRAVAADAQGIGGAGADLRGFAGGADDAGGGEGFKEGALAGGAPAVGTNLDTSKNGVILASSVRTGRAGLTKYGFWSLLAV